MGREREKERSFSGPMEGGRRFCGMAVLPDGGLVEGRSDVVVFVPNSVVCFIPMSFFFLSRMFFFFDPFVGFYLSVFLVPFAFFVPLPPPQKDPALMQGQTSRLHQLPNHVLGLPRSLCH